MDIGIPEDEPYIEILPVELPFEVEPVETPAVEDPDLVPA